MTTDQNTPTEKSPGRYWLDVANDTNDPLDMIGAALTGLLAVVTETTEAADAELKQLEEVVELEKRSATAESRIERALEVLGKSTSKVSIAVRAALEGQPAPTEGTDGGDA